MTIECADPMACERIAGGLVDTVTTANVLVVAGVVVAEIGRQIWRGAR
jgi:hypothetical protein